jgi:formate hydrogenlyase subunit 6/NADH:ubiquinone oxidoreductase subunit I
MLRHVMNNLFSRPSTRLEPQRRASIPGVRGTVAFETADCVYCGACGLRCPAKAIEVDRPSKTISFDLFKCVGCACCVEACKKGCVQMQEAYAHPSYQKPDILFQGAPVLKKEEKKLDPA